MTCLIFASQMGNKFMIDSLLECIIYPYHEHRLLNSSKLLLVPYISKLIFHLNFRTWRGGVLDGIRCLHCNTTETTLGNPSCHLNVSFLSPPGSPRVPHNPILAPIARCSIPNNIHTMVELSSTIPCKHSLHNNSWRTSSISAFGCCQLIKPKIFANTINITFIHT